MFDIVGLGDSDVDLMIAVDHLAGHDEKVRGRLLGKYPGGIVANFCCAAARFGARTGIITTVGDDEFGRLSVEDLERFGVDTGGLVVKRGEETYFCVVLLDETGEKALTIVQTSTLVPRKEDVDLRYATQTEYLHLPSLDLELAGYVAGKAREAGVKVSLDIEPTAARAGMVVWEEILRHSYVLFPNEAGLAALMGHDDLDCGARALLEMGPRLVVVTCGAKGVRIFAADQEFTVPAFKVAVQDTTGAGDCFNAVFLAGLVKGWGLPRAARYASAAAALSIQQVGARTGLPTLAEVEEFLRGSVTTA